MSRRYLPDHRANEIHFRKRAKERFGMVLNRNRRAEIKSDIVNGRADLLYARIKGDELRTVWIVCVDKVRGRLAQVVYDERHEVIVTVMHVGRKHLFSGDKLGPLAARYRASTPHTVK